MAKVEDSKKFLGFLQNHIIPENSKGKYSQVVGDIEKLLNNIKRTGTIEEDNQYLKLVEALIRDMPGCVNQTDPNGMTILHYAALLGLVQVAELVLKKGASDGLEDINGVPPLGYAERGGHEKIIQLLLEVPSQVKRSVLTKDKAQQVEKLKDLILNKDKAGLDKILEKEQILSFDDKAICSLLQMSAYLGNSYALRLLVFKGADVNLADNENATCLHKAVATEHMECIKYIVDKGANINAKDSDGWTPLHHAAYYNPQPELIEYLIEKGADVNVVDNEKISPLHNAVSAQDHIIVETLIKKGALVDAQDNKGATPLHIAAYENLTKICQLLLAAKANVNIKDAEGLTPIHHACFLGHNLIAEMLFNVKGINVNDVDNSGSTPLHKAAFSGHLKCTELLLQRGAKVEFSNGTTSPLHHAAYGGHLEVVKLLLAKGLKVNCQDPEKATPLHKAAYNGHLEVVKLLLENKADIHLRDEEGSTALHKAAYSGKVKVVSFLLEHGAEVDCQDSADGTPLHNACFSGHLDCVKTLLNAQANLNCADDHGASPLHLAVLNGHLEVAELLIKKGAQVDSPDDRGMTALHHAIAHKPCLALLLANGAEVDCKDNAGRTPLFYAAKNSCEEPCRFLILKGAVVDIKDQNGKTPLDVALPGFQRVIHNALKEREQVVDADTQKKIAQAVKMFNQKAKTGIEYLIKEEIIKSDPALIAKFLHTAEKLNKKMIGDYIGEADAENVRVLEAFCDYMDFSGLEFDDALRQFLLKFMLPGEAQKIDRIMERFAARYCENNPTVFPNPDTAYILAFSLIMLNTDAHNPSIKTKMTKEQFIRNNAGISEGKNLPREYLESLYLKIVRNEIKMEIEGSVFTNSEKKGWCTKQGGRVKTWKKRWFVLKDNCLYYFKQQSDTNPCGIIPLENLLVKPFDIKSKKAIFELYSPTGDIKACKLENGQLVKGHHGSYLISCKSKEEMDTWIQAIQNNIAFNPLFEMIQKRRQISSKRKDATLREEKSTSIDFQLLHSACSKCVTCYKGEKAVLEAFPNAIYGEESDKNMKYFFVDGDVQTIVICGSTPSESSKITDVTAKFEFPKIAENIDAKVRNLKRETPIHVFGHSLGAALAILFASHLQNLEYKIEHVITFGQPKVVRKKEASQYKSLPLLRIIDHYDPIPNTCFSGYLHVGPVVVLFDEAFYSYLSSHPEESGQAKADNHQAESYLKNLQKKIDSGAISIAYEKNKKL